ncbi:unnamed protein product [Pea early-browning virus]|uniref:Protein 2b n=1 Tax=Pea early browning virus TaxID=12294 RepID=2B_PEBV|nr:putative vector transmission protein [Pea early-browning virus]P14850.1 RecName: Full=Protein 2b; AltName: Full=29.6 kDa protein [Pea early-browning virus]CAA33893.1 unnamed protein product [Pea early-browning virus]CAA36126.1 unnamed protein product [Pea early-browning virus]
MTNWATLWPNDRLFLSDTYQLIWFDIEADRIEHKHFKAQNSEDISMIPKGFVSFVDNRLPMCINHKGEVYIRVGSFDTAYYQKFGDLDVSDFDDQVLPPDRDFTFNKVVFGDVPQEQLDNQIRDLQSEVSILTSRNVEMNVRENDLLKKVSELEKQIRQSSHNYEKVVEDGVVLSYRKAGGLLNRMVVLNRRLVGQRFVTNQRRWENIIMGSGVHDGSSYMAFNFKESGGSLKVTFDFDKLQNLSPDDLLAMQIA